MYIKDIYKDDIIKFKLDTDEIDIIDDVWEFIKKFNFIKLTLHEYRKNLISNIVNDYTEKEFFVLELISEKLIWNLRWLIYPLLEQKDISYDKYSEKVKVDSIPDNILSLQVYDIALLDNIKTKLYDSNYYRSFINKIIQVDDTKNRIYYKPLEGSMPIFNKNTLNTITMVVMRDRKLYEQIMHNPFEILNYQPDIPELYYQFDYPFPNINCCSPFIGSTVKRQQKINKMYYDKNAEAAENNWFNFFN